MQHGGDGGVAYPECDGGDVRMDRFVGGRLVAR
jgi:hypothetical protein